MALTATPMRFEVALSHVDRGIYETLELKMARHPSETMRYLLCRLLAYCVVYEPGLAFSKGGLSSVDEPAISLRSLDGRLLLQVEIGSPSAERLHKASKAAERLVVFTQHDPALLVASLRGQKIHRREDLEVYALSGAFLDELGSHIGDRGGKLEVTVSDGELYVTVAGWSSSHALSRIPLAGD